MVMSAVSAGNDARDVDAMLTGFLEQFGRKVEAELGSGLLMPVYTLSTRQQEELYALGYGYYSQGRYLDAVKLFWQLLRQDCAQARYYKAAGACMQMLQHYEQAMLAYGLASLFEPHDPTLLFYLAQCFRTVGCAQEAAQALQTFLVDTAGSVPHRAMREQAATLLASIAQPPQENHSIGGKDEQRNRNQ